MNALLRKTALAAVIATPFFAHADPFNVIVDTNTDLQFGVAVYTYEDANHEIDIVDHDIEATLATGSHVLASDAMKFNGVVHYTYLAVYTGGGISIGLDSDVANDAIANDTPYEDLLYRNRSEDDVVHDLMQVHSDDPIAVEEAVDGLTTFISGVRNLLPEIHSGLKADDGVMTKFSGATYGGSISGQPVPEPASLCALGLGAAALIRRRRG